MLTRKPTGVQHRGRCGGHHGQGAEAIWRARCPSPEDGQQFAGCSCQAKAVHESGR